ncbi:MAG: histidine phosphatase family protein [Planctomycetota bacterium]
MSGTRKDFAATLVLVRHAAAKPATPGQSDFDRELTDGAAEPLGDLGIEIFFTAFATAVFSSPAKRTFTTACEIANGYGLTPPETDERLYQAAADTLREFAFRKLNEDESPIIVAHNPGISLFASQLAGVTVRFAPAGWAAFGFEGEESLSGRRLPEVIEINEDWADR